MGDGKLAIVMPTFRYDSMARHCIRTAAAMASDDVKIYIGDNSCNPEKWAFLEQLARTIPGCNVFCHDKNLGANDNFLFLLDRQNHEFVCMASDDDVFTADYFLAGLEKLKADSACAAASGLLLFLTPHASGLNVSAPRENTASTPLKRIENYTGPNNFPYAVLRRASLTDYLIYTRKKPLMPSYMDQFLAYNLLSQGTFVMDVSRRIFVYDAVNWSNENTFESDAKFYEAAGLAKSFTHLHTLNWAMDAVHYFHSIYRPYCLEDAEADAIAQLICERFLEGSFLPRLKTDPAMFVALFNHAPESLAALQALIVEPRRNIKRMLSLFVIVLRAFSSDLADRHDAFVTASLRPEGSNAVKRSSFL